MRLRVACGRLMVGVLLVTGFGCGAKVAAPAGLPAGLPAGQLPEVVDGQGLAKALAALRGQPALVNVWATWCQPCMAELPDLIAATLPFRAEGGRVLGISMDFLDSDSSQRRQQLEKVARAIARVGGMDYQNVVYDGDPDRIEELIHYAGVAPWTIALDREGKIVAEHTGRVTRAEFVALAEAARVD